ncbi:hypothetical protein BGW42_005249 [Actinomortierella wolfii]|nr:hypothetical protein BGW42_005249 [Actinomortierella wolfii]
MSSSSSHGHKPLVDERAPLLDRRNNATPSSSSSPPTDGQKPSPAPSEATNDSAIYVKVLESSLPWYRRPSPLWLLPIYVIVATTAGMLLSSLVPFQSAMLCREYLNHHTTNTTLLGDYAFTTFAKDPRCLTPDIQSYTAKTLGSIEVLSGIASTLSVGYYTSLSDRHGRVKMIAFAFCSTIVMLCSIVLMDSYWDQIGLPLMFASGILNGAMGGIGLGLTIFLAYSADCTDPSKRSLIYSWVHAALFLGLTLGPAIGGMITTATGTVLTIVYIDLGVNVVSLILVLLAMPESLPHLQSPRVQQLFREAKRKARREAGLVDLDDDDDSEHESGNGDREGSSNSRPDKKEYTAWHTHAVRSLMFFKPNGRNTNLILLAAISFLQTLTVKGTMSVIVLYTQRVFNWDSLEVGLLFSIGNFGRLLSLIVVLPLLVLAYERYTKKRQARQEKQNQSQTDQDAASSRHQSTVPASDTFTTLYHDENDIMAAASVEELGESILERQRNKSAHGSPSTSYTQPADKPDHSRLATNDSASSWSSNKTKAPATNNTTQPSSPKGGEADRAQKDAFSGLKFDTWMIRLGFAINSITYFQLGLAASSAQFYFAAALHAFAIISTPSLKSLLTMMVEPSQFGAVLGALQVVDAIASIFSPIVINWVYAITVYKVPEFIWYVCGVWMGICVVLSFMIRQKEFRRRSAA